MNKLTQEEQQLLTIIRDLKLFETIEIKRNEKDEVIYIYTKKEKYIFLTLKQA